MQTENLPLKPRSHLSNNMIILSNLTLLLLRNEEIHYSNATIVKDTAVLQKTILKECPKVEVEIYDPLDSVIDEADAHLEEIASLQVVRYPNPHT